MNTLILPLLPLHSFGLDLQRAERIQKIRANLHEHEVNRAAAQQAGDSEGVRIANAGIERCESLLRILMSPLFERAA